MRLSYLCLFELLVCAGFAANAGAVSGFDSLYATIDFEDWRAAGGLPGSYDPSAGAYPSDWITGAVLADFSALPEGDHQLLSIGSHWHSFLIGSPGEVVSVQSQGVSNTISAPLSSLGGPALVITPGSLCGAAPASAQWRGLGIRVQFVDAGGQPQSGRVHLRLASGSQVVTNFIADLGFKGFWMFPSEQAEIGSIVAVWFSAFSNSTATKVVITSMWSGFAAPFSACAADVNGDCLVDGADLSDLLARWGQVEGQFPYSTCDFDGDGVIGGADLAQLLLEWGECSA
jgi:hypothetical protein